jgi:hypothetical protein
MRDLSIIIRSLQLIQIIYQYYMDTKHINTSLIYPNLSNLSFASALISLNLN